MGTAAQPIQRRFVYSASALGVGAVLKEPAKYAQSWAPSCLPIIGGRSTSSALNVDWPSPADPVLHFDEAWTQITGEQTKNDETDERNPRQYTTTIQVAVTNLNILNRVMGDIDVTIVWKYEVGRSREDDHTDVHVVSNLVPDRPYAKILFRDDAGVQSQGHVEVDGLYRGVCQDWQTIAVRQKAMQATAGSGAGVAPAATVPYWHPHGVIFSELGGRPRLMGPRATKASGPAQRVAVHFAEWHGAPYRQNFTLLRVELDEAQDALKPQTRFTGQIVVDEEVNGREYP